MGHTDYFRNHYRSEEALMLMTGEYLKVATVTEHLPLADVSKALTSEQVYLKIRTLSETLQRDFGIVRPRIAVLGINPHAGDEGKAGNEENDIIKPAIEKATEVNMLIFGPYSADGFFGAGTFRKFDATLAMYHDQGLIPFKMLSFESGVNVTAGLPVIRTSPDHGPAFEIAGQGLASESSFRCAVYAAIDIARNRKKNKKLSKASYVSRMTKESQPEQQEIV
jgi:4-hydroxythreonine-4-phosphate dehydrogenase